MASPPEPPIRLAAESYEDYVRRLDDWYRLATAQQPRVTPTVPPDGTKLTEVPLSALADTLWRVVRLSEQVPAGKLYRVDLDPPQRYHFGFLCHPDMKPTVDAERERLLKAAA